MKKKLLELLEAKFPGARKDGLQQLANSLSLTVTTEDEATAVVGKITADQVTDYIKEWRRVADAENSAAAQTRENNIREKYDLTEKGTPAPAPTPAPTPKPGEGATFTAQDIQKIVEEAVTKATQGLQSTVATMQATDIAKARREKIEALFGKDTPETYKKTVLAGFEGRTFKDDADFDAFAEQTKTNHAAFMQDMADRSLRGEKPLLGGTNKDGVSNAVESYVKTKTEQNGNDLGGKDPFKN